MPSGSCLCGKINISYDGEPAVKELHSEDSDDQQSAFSTNAVVPEKGFEVTGNPKTFKKTADSGSAITSFFCGDCGNTLFREAVAFPGMKIVKAGVLDDKGAMDSVKPAVELFASERIPWVAQVRLALQSCRGNLYLSQLALQLVELLLLDQYRFIVQVLNDDVVSLRVYLHNDGLDGRIALDKHPW
ncbi:hypothetical protein FH972_026476 [Carpinus fangiana]|uniref:CENP-V/GFA domain-containing protein n=1 Tax=Carpinus fangiana TaxID=176857 RepID=A0A5N6L524_9ROSI|nr:hypothetical protein FH972_026476 [Carpinus fangiana]